MTGAKISPMNSDIQKIKTTSTNERSSFTSWLLKNTWAKCQTLILYCRQQLPCPLDVSQLFYIANENSNKETKEQSTIEILKLIKADDTCIETLTATFELFDKNTSKDVINDSSIRAMDILFKSQEAISNNQKKT